jgi:hypothetical protein
VAFAAVIVLHAALVITLGIALRTAPRRSPVAEAISTFILLPAPAVPAPPPEIQRPSSLGERVPLEPVEPPTLPPEMSLPITPGTYVDWGAEAGRAATAMTEPMKFREFGHHGRAESAPQSRTPAHQAGEQYRVEAGEWIVWVSDRCYIVSGVPPLGVADVIARSIPTHTVCQGDSATRGDLFQELPAYQKYQH